MLKRQTAWCLMLAIDCNSEEYKNFSDMYYEVLENNPSKDDADNHFLKMMLLDVRRTFVPFGLKFLNSDVSKGSNKLYNLLKVYALILDPEIGYTQGMNFIAAFILMNVSNEVLACQMFMKILQKDNWARMFISSTPKLFDLCQKIKDRLAIEDKQLSNHLVANDIILEIVLAGPLMTIFSNTTNLSITTHIMNCFILDGESYILDIILHLFKSVRKEIMAYKDQFEI